MDPTNKSMRNEKLKRKLLNRKSFSSAIQRITGEWSVINKGSLERILSNELHATDAGIYTVKSS